MQSPRLVQEVPIQHFHSSVRATLAVARFFLPIFALCAFAWQNPAIGFEERKT
jgi:hypothetical protein